MHTEVSLPILYIFLTGMEDLARRLPHERKFDLAFHLAHIVISGLGCLNALLFPRRW